VRFNLLQCLTVTLIFSLAIGLWANQARKQREIDSLRRTIADSRDTFQMIAYGKATLQLLDLNPAIPDDADCLPILKHDLAFAVFNHWRFEHLIDNVAETPGYAKRFTKRALHFLQCNSADDFVKLCKSKLVMYPDDELEHSVWNLSESELVSFENFIRTALRSTTKGG
jgi:hypothetical protein